VAKNKSEELKADSWGWMVLGQAN